MVQENSQAMPLDVNVINPYIPFGEYLNGLTEAVNVLGNHMSRGELENLVFKKLRMDDANPTEYQYHQSAVELTVCAHFARFFGDGFIYEEKINKPKDVDCSFISNGMKFNVEVKCADYSRKHAIEEGSDFRLGSLGRTEGFVDICKELGELFSSSGDEMVAQLHMDNKLKDFLISADGKFSVESRENELNILVVGCDDPMDMQKWYSYLYGAEGLFTEQSFSVPQLYNRVDVVVLSNLYHRHKDVKEKNLIKYHWRLSEAFNLLCGNPNSLKKQDLFNEFSRTVPHFTREVSSRLAEGEAPDFILQAFAIPDFIVRELYPQQIYHFQPVVGEKQNG